MSAQAQPHLTRSLPDRARPHEIRSPAQNVENHAPGATIAEEGSVQPRRFLLSGWAARSRMLSDGRRQIISLLVPGDLCCLEGLEGPAPFATIALTRAQTAEAGGAAAELTTPAQETCRLISQVVRLGRMTAYERTAHLLLELWERLSQVGLTRGGAMPLPLTQEVLADALGVSVVHMNRTLQQLRRDGLIVSRFGAVILADPQRLADLCGYEPPQAGRAATVQGLASSDEARGAAGERR